MFDKEKSNKYNEKNRKKIKNYVIKHRNTQREITLEISYKKKNYNYVGERSREEKW